MKDLRSQSIGRLVFMDVDITNKFLREDTYRNPGAISCQGLRDSGPELL